MKITMFAALAASLMGASALQAGTAPPPPPPITTAPAPVGGPYLEINAGPLWVGDINGIGFDTGWGINGEIGWSLGNGVSFGFNSGYYEAGLDSGSIRINGTNVVPDGDFQSVPLMATANYSFTISGPLSGYVGVGAGLLWISGDANIRVRGREYAATSTDDWNFALQARAGLSYALSSNASINVGYRYLHGFFSDDDLNGNMVEGGFKITF